jgi:hypothetical protein
MRLTQEEVQKIKEKAINGHMIREHGYDDEGNFIDRGISYLPAHMVYKDEGLIDLCDTIEALRQENKEQAAVLKQAREALHDAIVIFEPLDRMGKDAFFNPLTIEEWKEIKCEYEAAIAAIDELEVL